MVMIHNQEVLKNLISYETMGPSQAPYQVFSQSDNYLGFCDLSSTWLVIFLPYYRTVEIKLARYLA